MKLLPLLTEKSLEQAKKGDYTFWVAPSMNKYQIKKAVEETFGVKVTGVRTLNLKKRTKRSLRGKMQTIRAKKKAIVTLAEKQKIDLFEEKK